jgi:superfamily II DNA/RNA helicase
LKVAPNNDPELYEHRPVLPPDQVNFSMLGFSTSMVSRLKDLNIVSPTAIQQRAIPEVLVGRDVLLASETGSGKTLAYLLPLVHKLTQKRSGVAGSTGPPSPEAVVIVPSQELCLRAQQNEYDGLLEASSHSCSHAWLVEFLRPKLFLLDKGGCCG